MENCLLSRTKVYRTQNISILLIPNFRIYQKKIYVNKSLELLDDDENKFMWYRNVLYSRAKTLPDCPPGRLISRRTTKSNNSTERYARDCHTLYMFTQGEKSGLNVIFDKSKTIPVPSETSKHEPQKLN